MIKIGQIGIGHNHGSGKMEAIRRYPDLFQAVGFAEENEEWIEKRGTLDVYRDLPRLSVDEIIEKSDAILVETDVWNLTKTAQMCVEAGKHIHLDKPASGSLEEYKQVLDTAENKNLVVQLGYMYRYNPTVMRCINAVKSGKLGEVFSVNAEMSTLHSDEYRDWLKHFKGGIMYILGSHLIDLIVYMLGEPENIVPFLKCSQLNGIDVQDNNFAVLEYEKAIARIFVSSVEVNGWGRRQLVVSGSEGTIDIKPLENRVHATYADRLISTQPYEDMKRVLDVEDVPMKQRYDQMVKSFYNYVTGIEKNPFDYAHEYSVQKTIYRVTGEI